jgi:hypothetical protein
VHLKRIFPATSLSQIENFCPNRLSLYGQPNVSPVGARCAGKKIKTCKQFLAFVRLMNKLFFKTHNLTGGNSNEKVFSSCSTGRNS